tara:strand:- start:1052 stop:1273 length:222 start_codon:yes stop_codon:yes gene_type:complete
MFCCCGKISLYCISDIAIKATSTYMLYKIYNLLYKYETIYIKSKKKDSIHNTEFSDGIFINIGNDLHNSGSLE